jgi:hypothetical protein
MSTNFHIYAVRDILVIKTNKKEQQYKNFKCLQTPTSHTWIMMNSENPIEAYKEWVIASSDAWLSESHLMELTIWINLAKNEGFDIRWEAW